MKEFFRRLFNIYPGEEKSALLFAGLGFLWAFGVTAGQKFADALFLLHVGAHSLPTAYAIIACILMVLTAFFLKAFNSISIEKIFISALLVGIVFYSVAYFCLAEHIGMESKILWYALKIYGTAFFAIIVTCFWTFIDQYFHLQDAKRLYSLFTSSVFLGLATTGLIMRSGLIEFQYMVLGIIVLFFLASLRIRQISQVLKPVYDESSLEGYSESGVQTFRALLDAVINSPFTLLLMSVNFLTYVLLVITEYSYMSAFDSYFDPGSLIILGEEEKAPLTQFLGQLLASVSIFNLFFGLFIYSRLIRQFGITALVLYTPVILVLNFSGWSSSNSYFSRLLDFLSSKALYTSLTTTILTCFSMQSLQK